MLTHGVNIGQAIKSEAVWSRRSHDDTDADSTRDRLAKLDRYHGVPSGMFQVRVCFHHALHLRILCQCLHLPPCPGG